MGKEYTDNMVYIDEIKLWVENNNIISVVLDGYQSALRNYELEELEEYNRYGISKYPIETKFNSLSISFPDLSMSEINISIKYTIWINAKYSGYYTSIFKYPSTEMVDDYFVLE